MDIEGFHRRAADLRAATDRLAKAREMMKAADTEEREAYREQDRATTEFNRFVREQAGFAPDPFGVDTAQPQPSSELPAT